MKEYEFSVKFYDTFGTFYVDADNCDEAYTRASDTIMNAIKDLPIEVEFEVDCVAEPEEEEEEDD